jgi:hypothetical protein
MAEYTISGRSSIVPTAARGGVSLHSIAAVAPKIKEIAVFNTSVTAFIAAVMKTTNATGVGSGLTEVLTPLIGTANGITITCPTGTGQTFDYYIRWEE